MRLAAIDWAMLETTLALGAVPVAGAELIRFRDDAPPGLTPEGIVDLGLRGAPNYELLQLSRPDLILSSPFYSHYEDRLRQIAPVLSLPIYTDDAPPLTLAMAALGHLAEALGDPAAGRAAQRRAEDALSAQAASLRAHADQPLCLIEIGDARHMRVFGHDSLYGSTAARLGLRNGWAERTAFSFLAPVPLEELANMPEARLVIIGPLPPQARRALSRSVLWRALPQVSGGRVWQLPRMNAFGAVPSALRFARELAAAFRAGPVEALA
ncbi:iron complex transport system substrate-binding protein [Paracoccus isoporae]|uniref:Iron complex transport system substrate-binding protein n=2 Tax=Paracoccus isoporae TaxID=591205 RepID=A0A1G6WZP3_9RHOB|nr:iron complex transport system substrate-binding protein [Paracoccus isoporae]